MQALIGLGNALYDMGQPEKAVIQYRKALEQDNDLSDVHYNLANTLYMLQQTEEAITHY
jgi:tetratricopeptide (TPR) repeat protein